ncbi:hypothetical protein [Teredinibacter turnerae]|uniref:hypothetical protein n=1 Tax=Teredinibacter turnerae TaxID=2426 RepID=UPI00117CFC58|nr:hypothetical protein [Teredinibacter turnerae]
MGNWQIEFFDLEDERYFVLYGSYGNSYRQRVFKLCDYEFSSILDGGHVLTKGRTTTTIRFYEHKDKLRMELAIKWRGWLLVSRFRGNVSNMGRQVVKENLERYFCTE